MTEKSGIARALEVLGDKIKETEAQLNVEKTRREIVSGQLDDTLKRNKELLEQLKQAEKERDDACRYALKLENLLEGCKAVYNDLTAGGADKCKKS